MRNTSDPTKGWLPPGRASSARCSESGHRIGARPSYEIYRNNPMTVPKEELLHRDLLPGCVRRSLRSAVGSWRSLALRSWQLWELALCHSQRSATIGSTCDARRAGRYAAAPATRARTAVATANVTGSAPEIPNSWLLISRPTARAIGTPTPMPVATSVIGRPHLRSEHDAPRGAERHADPDLASAPDDRVGHQPVQPDACQHGREDAEERGEPREQLLADHRPVERVGDGAASWTRDCRPPPGLRVEASP